MIPIKLEQSIRKNKLILLISFKYDKAIFDIVRKFPNANWEPKLKKWVLPYSDESRRMLETALHSKGHLSELIILKKPEKHQTLAPLIATDVLDQMEKFIYWMRSKRYSESTIQSYSDALKTFFRFNSGKSIADISNEDLITFNNVYILGNNYSASFQNQVVNGLKLFFKIMNDKRIDIESIERPKRAKKLPNVLSREEVKLLLERTRNLKHKAMLSLIYGCGLRCGELLKLKPEHIDSRRGILIIQQAKGRKDRISPLSAKLTELLRNYYIAYRPKVYLFEGMKVGEPYDERSLQSVLKQNLAKTGIKKPVTLHWLRHSYATHLLENGTDLRYIQEILGHSSSKTTEIYTHVSTKSIQNIRSPFDEL